MNTDQDKQRELAQKLSKNISQALELMAQIDLKNLPVHTLEMLVNNMEPIFSAAHIFHLAAIEVLKNNKDEHKMLKEKS